MRSTKWLYACTLAIVLGMLSFTAVSCHDDDDPKQEEGEVIETPAPIVEYYIMGTVTKAGEGLANAKVVVGDKTLTTDASGKFSITEGSTGTYAIEASLSGYLSQKTSVVIAADAVNRSVLTVALTLTAESPKTTVEAEAGGTVEDNSSSNANIQKPEDVKPEDVVEDLPLAKAELEIPEDALAENTDISVTTFVPAPSEVTTEVKAFEENKEVAKSIPLAAAHFEPTGLEFKEEVMISIPNPIPDVTFITSEMQLTYLNPNTGKWDVEQGKDVTIAKSGSYQAPITHFSSYAVENKVISIVGKESIDKSDKVGAFSLDNSQNAKAVTGVKLTYKEKSGWEYVGDIESIVKQKLTGASIGTVNAMVAYLKTRMFSLMGSVSGIAQTERTYNTVNVNGFTKMDYACYPKTRTTTLKTTVKYKDNPVTIEVSVKRYTGVE